MYLYGLLGLSVDIQTCAMRAAEKTSVGSMEFSLKQNLTFGTTLAAATSHVALDRCHSHQHPAATLGGEVKETAWPPFLKLSAHATHS